MFTTVNGAEYLTQISKAGEIKLDIYLKKREEKKEEIKASMVAFRYSRLCRMSMVAFCHSYLFRMCSVKLVGL